MVNKPHFEDFCEDKARAGDGAFAIAFALLQLGRSHERGVKALQAIGTGDVHGQGALEMVAKEMKGLSDSLEIAVGGIANAISARD